MTLNAQVSYATVDVAKKWNLTEKRLFSECDAKESVWICTTCGVLNCGRYVKAHALAHYEDEANGHSVCLECQELSVFW